MKRFISVIMALLMCFTAVAIGINSTVANAADPSASNFLLSNPAPAGLDSTDNPYGQPVDRPFSLSTMNELFYYQSWDGSYEQYKFDLFTGRDPNLGLDYSSAYKENDGSDVWLKDPNRYNSSNPDDAKVEFANSNDNLLQKYRLSYVQSVGCDPYGHGKDDHIAFIGFSNYQDSSNNWINKVYVIVQDLKTNTQYQLCAGDARWIKNLKVPYYLEAAYFEIAAGDFDNDGRDSLIIYYPADDNRVRICEITFTVTGTQQNPSLSLLGRDIITVGDLRPESRDLLTDKDDQWQFKPTVSFAVGDFDANGVEDLAISTGFGNPGDTEDGLSEQRTCFERYVTGVSIMDLS